MNLGTKDEPLLVTEDNIDSKTPEELGFAIEMALEFGFETDEDLTTVTATNEQLYALMKCIGYKHKGEPTEPVFQLLEDDLLGCIEPELSEHEPIHCDVCGKHIEDYEGDLFHHTGKLHGKLNPHVHVCKDCHRNANPLIIDFDALRAIHDLDYGGAQYE